MMKNLSASDVAGVQIITALCMELGKSPPFAKGTEYRKVQDAANDAREEGLLINPNEFTRYSTRPGNPSKMFPSVRGWARTKEILREHFNTNA